MGEGEGGKEEGERVEESEKRWGFIAVLLLCTLTSRVHNSC